MSDDALDPGLRHIDLSLRHSGDESAAPVQWGIAEEAAVEIDINGEPVAVTMASPVDLEDLAVGFVFTEGVVRAVGSITDVAAKRTMEGWIVDITLPIAAVDEARRRARLLEGRAGCGLCGVESLSAAMQRPLRRDDASRSEVALAALQSAFAELTHKQPLNAATRSVHAAAWCDLDGAIVQVCEDVGRLNALDKLVGWSIRTQPAYPGFVLLSSRVSYELVCKAVAMGASLLAAVSAPTTLALDLAASAELPLAFAGPDGSIVTTV
jgi:FdhD protein